jgi:hypothetical protein
MMLSQLPLALDKGSMMPLSQQYITTWQEWHDNRIRDLNRPYGFLSVVSQDWLPDAEFFTSEFVPGQWMLRDGEIYYHPDQKSLEKGDFLIVDGKKATAPTHIPHGYNKNSGTGSAVPVFYGDLEVETLTRLNDRGESIYAVRVRDPREAASKRFDDIETFLVSDEWIVPAKFSAAETVSLDIPTVEAGIYETGFTFGTLDVLIKGQRFSLEVHGHRAGSEASGYFSDDTRVHFGDLTNGKETYGGGRVIRFKSREELERLTELDFNRSISLPCALSTFVACAAVPAGNRLPFRVTAGEYTPPTPHERVPTYKG